MLNHFSIKKMLIISLGVLGLCSTAHSLKPVQRGEQTRKSNTMPIYNKSTGESYIPSDDAMGLGVWLSGQFMALKIYDRTLNIDFPIYVYKGEYWFAGIPGNEYSLHLQNNVNSPPAFAAVSIDEVNTLSGLEDSKTSHYGRPAYLLSQKSPTVISSLWWRNKIDNASLRFPGHRNSSSSSGIFRIALFDEMLDPLYYGIRPAIPKQVIMLSYDSPENLVTRGILIRDTRK